MHISQMFFHAILKPSFNRITDIMLLLAKTDFM